MHQVDSRYESCLEDTRPPVTLGIWLRGLVTWVASLPSTMQALLVLSDARPRVDLDKLSRRDLGLAVERRQDDPFTEYDRWTR